MAFTLTQINDLVNAGYKLEDILAVNGPVGDPPVQKEKPVEKPVETVEKPVVTVEKSSEDKILDAINNLVQTIQTGNMRMGGFPAPASVENPDQILANIINPPAKTGKK